MNNSLFKNFKNGQLSLGKLSAGDIAYIRTKLYSFEKNNNNSNISNVFVINKNKVIIYKSGSVVVSSLNNETLEELLNYLELKFFEKLLQKKPGAKDIKVIKNEETRSNFYITSAGSDESGKGDYYGGICVCACYIDSQAIAKLKEKKILNQIIDSKKLSDLNINKIAPLLMNVLYKKYFVYHIEPKTYNYFYSIFQNLNVLLIYAHNVAWNGLSALVKSPITLKVIDQFCEKKTYYSFELKINEAFNKKKVLKEKVSLVLIDKFETKAEEKFISVAAASIIARYEFLKQMESLSKIYECKLPLGNSYHGHNSVILTFAKLKKQNLSDDFILQHLCKRHFITTKKILNQ